MGNKPAFFMLWLGAPESKEAEWNTWLNKVHVPAVLKVPGVLFARRYTAVEGDRKYFHLYGLADAGVLSSKPYLELRSRERSKADPAAIFAAMTDDAPDSLSGVYEQIYPPDRQFLGPQADTILTVGIDIPPQKDEEFNIWYNTEHIPANLRSPGWLAASRFAAIKGGVVPGHKTNGAQYVALWDIEGSDVFSSPEFRKSIGSPWTRWVHTWYTRRQRAIYRPIL